ncbi:hypothetical protein RDWZM_001677 [Blomia tropicalis]|uniref:TLC domain-containing protein n=1 Tax=Blomia tropicalis TaxID=40697 RepID=A0A9Q0MCL4_BLOTA|nr:hypothetical protein RDWZM_001677 [Blomia tropicalis]
MNPIQISVHEPTYTRFIIDSYNYMYDSVRYIANGQYGLKQFGTDLSLLIGHIRPIDLVPLTIRRTIPEREAKKIPESAWKFIFYLTTWISAAILIFGNEKAQYFKYPERVWQNYSVKSPIENGIYALYMIELSFYIHSLYTTMLVDIRRKDTLTLMFHHIICILLLTISYCNKTHKSGLLCLFLHDGSDVLLEGTKLIRSFKIQNGKTYSHVETFVNIGFGLFLLTWVTNRLYWFPIKQVYLASVYVREKSIPVPFISFLVALLWIILLMNYYWFSFALQNETLLEGKDENDSRKLSIDSGVLLQHGDSGTETEQSIDDDYEEEEEERKKEKTNSIDENKCTIATTNVRLSPGYNLRNRKMNESQSINGEN